MPDVLSWDLQELKGLAREKHGAKAAEELGLYTHSLSKKINIAAYHSLESRGLLETLFAHLAEGESYTYGIELMFGAMSANIDEDMKSKSALFYNNSWKAEAHVVSCAYAVLSIVDIMAQVINSALNLEIPVNNVTINRIKLKIGDYNELLRKLEELLNYDEYKYFLAFVNSQKHICFIPVTYTFKMQVEGGEKTHGLKIPRFLFKEEVYPEKWSDDLVTTDFVKLKDKVLEIGMELNCILKPN
jgi:hypothetical protein